MSDKKTPWQRVHAKFGIPQSQLAAKIKRHRSKVSRALKDEYGLISGKDQQSLMRVAEEMGVNLTPADLMPNAR